MAESMFGKKILILVPHPDDEVVAAAATIVRAQKSNSKVFALYLTTGCISRETMWPWKRKFYENNVAVRRSEAEQAAQFLHISPVGWSDRPARHLWRDLPAAIIEVKETIAKHSIDQLWVPAFEGGNADHDALNAMASLLAANENISVMEFAEYNYCGGTARSNQFPLPNGTETIIQLTADEKEMKTSALEIYASEKCNLGYVKTKQESFRPLAKYNYSAPPHEGTLWYNRFHWVPFKHPRVDFSKPAEVYSTITSNLFQS